MADVQESSDDSLLVVTFELGGALFGINARHVQEVVKVGDITPVHDAPPYVVGIRNLRGRIVTVIDLACRLEMGCVDRGHESRVMIVDLQSEPIGLLVDSVADTIATSEEEVAPAPPSLHGIQARDLIGVCRSGERLVALLDAAAALQVDDAVQGRAVEEQETA